MLSIAYNSEYKGSFIILTYHKQNVTIL